MQITLSCTKRPSSLASRVVSEVDADDNACADFGYALDRTWHLSEFGLHGHIPL